MTHDTRRESALASAYRRTGLSAREAWFRYLALGGNADEIWVEFQLSDLLRLPPGEYNVLAQALNERLDELPAFRRGPKVALQDLRVDSRSPRESD
jgi:hypothetical protein